MEEKFSAQVGVDEIPNRQLEHTTLVVRNGVNSYKATSAFLEPSDQDKFFILSEESR